MGDKSKIQWTTATWNPVTGCTKVSQGCKHCYAETLARRVWATQYPPNPDGTPRRFTDVRLHPERLNQPIRWTKPRMIFVNSMSDLFHEAVPFEFIDEIMGVAALCPQHTFQVLTKRPERMLEYARTIEAGDLLWPLPNVWLGVSVEDQATADKRIPLLAQTTAAIRFLSCEPQLGPVDLSRWLPPPPGQSWAQDVMTAWGEDIGRLSWVIVGGESGPGARPFNIAWAHSIVQQCRSAGVACFVKQLGARPYRTAQVGWTNNVPMPFRLNDRKGGDWSEWDPDLRVREFPKPAL